MSLKGIQSLINAIRTNYDRLCCIVANTSQSNELLATLATEATQLNVLAAVDSMRDYEVRLVVDENDITWLEVRYWDAQGDSLGAPVYYPPGSTTPGTPSGPSTSWTYINPNTFLAQLVTELQALNTVDFATETTLSNVETLISTIDGVLDAIKTDTGNMLTSLATEATLLDVETALDTIKVDTANLDVLLSSRASELTLQALLTELQLKADLSETQPVSAASLPLPTGAATEATLNLVDSSLAAINTDIQLTNIELANILTALNGSATEATLVALSAKLNSLGQKASAASAPVVLSTEQETILTAINTVLGNTLNVQLSTVASEGTLLSTNSLLTTIDAVLDNIKLDTAKLALGAGSTVTAVPSSASNQTLQASNANRKSVKIYNNSDVDLRVKEGTASSLASFTWNILPGEHVVIDDYSGIITGISVSSPTGTILVTETTY